MLDTPTLVKTALHALNGHEGPSREDLCHWYELMHLGRLLDDKAPNYLKQAIGWSYHAPCAGHDGIQLAAGLAFRAGRDFLFPYYRDLLTCLHRHPERVQPHGEPHPARRGPGPRGEDL